jgi:hypothetical protein
MEKEALARFMEIEETLYDVVASIGAIKQILRDAKIAEPQTLQDLFLEMRMKMSDSPGGQSLRMARHSLVFEKDTH